MAGRLWAFVCVPGPAGSDWGAGTSHCRTAAHQTVGHALGMLQTITKNVFNQQPLTHPR